MVATRQQEPNRYSMCCLWTFCVCLSVITKMKDKNILFQVFKTHRKNM